MNAVTTIKPHISSIQCPAGLRQIQGWLMWRYEHHENEPKPRKIPYYASGQKRSGQQGGPEDRRHLTTFDAARAAAARKGMDGVGIALLPDWGLAALDFDHCTLPDGSLHPEVAEIAAQSYAEWSPSGSGVRVLFKGDLLNRKSHGGPYGFETFSTKGFVTFTGNRLDITEVLGNENTLADVTPEVVALYAKRFKPREVADVDADGQTRRGMTDDELRELLAKLPNEDLPYESDDGQPSWLGVGMALHHETSGAGFHLWDEWSQASSKYTHSDYGHYKWVRFGNHGGASITVHSLARWAGVDLEAASPEDFDDLTVNADGTPKPLKFAVVTDEVFMQRPAPRWIVKGLVPEGDLLVLFGETGAGKSFVALDIFGAVARGVPWRGLRVRQRRVAFIVAEGGGGFRNRLCAYRQHHGAAPGVLVMHAAPNLMERGDATEVAKALAAAGGADIVVVDTFAQTTPGANENAGEDIGKALKNCRGISQALGGALVVLVHHTGKDTTRGARGWSGLKAAADAEIEVGRAPAGRYLRTSKQKDGDDGLEWGFALEVVTVGIDEDGDEITSCVVREAEVPKADAGKKLGKVEAIVNDTIQSLLTVGAEALDAAEVIRQAAARMPEEEGAARDTRRQRAKRALENLCKGDDAAYFLASNGRVEVI